LKNSLFTSDDIYYFKEGTHYKLYNKLGSHYGKVDNKEGFYFSTWAPNAKYVSLISDFNSWDKDANPMVLRDDDSGIWECFVEGMQEETNYKFYIESKLNNQIFQKSDPYAKYWEKPPKSSSKTYRFDYKWRDKNWIDRRAEKNSLDKPISIYELHLGSWIRDKNLDFLNYRDLADELSSYIKERDFTHIELLPVTEHPFYGSWGYQSIGYFAPTSRYGKPEDFMYFVDKMHLEGIGVILDWVPSHFAVDSHGLANFDGTNLYEHSDPRQGFHPEWGSYVFNFGRHEVREFLISSAHFWFDLFHIDGIRVDAVASILYLDYAREDGDWIANREGGNANLDAVDFLKELNSSCYRDFGDILMIAEESTAWSKVSKPIYDGGLGFGLKWNMGWMHDSLKYLSRDFIHRKFHQDQITFSIWYAFNENFQLALSHDEVVHMKGSLINKMSGDYWQKFANLRVLYAYMYAHPGKKLLFMGGEFAQFREWDYNSSLDWNLLEYENHSSISKLITDLNGLYRKYDCLYRFDFDERGFSWVDINDREKSIISFLRKGEASLFLIICNFTPSVHESYKIGVPANGKWREILNTDDKKYGGSGVVNSKEMEPIAETMHGFDYSIEVTLSPLSVSYIELKG